LRRVGAGFCVAVCCVLAAGAPVRADESPATAVNAGIAADGTDATAPDPHASRYLDLENRALQPPGTTAGRRESDGPDRKRTRTSEWLGGSLLGLAIVLGIIVAIAVLIRRLLARSGRPTGSVIKVLSRSYLSGKQCLCLVRVGEKLVLVGATPTHLSSLAVIDDAEDVARLLGQIEGDRSSSSAAAFRQFLGREVGRFGPDVSAASATADPLEASAGVARVRGQIGGLLGRLRRFGAPADDVKSESWSAGNFERKDR